MITKERLALVITLAAALVLGAVYLDANQRANLSSDELKEEVSRLESRLNAANEAWMLLNVTDGYKFGDEKAQITYEGGYSSMYNNLYNAVTGPGKWLHIHEYCFIYVPRSNMTLKINASVHDSTRDIPIAIFKGTTDIISHYTNPPLSTVEAKPDTWNEFFVTLPQAGWYSVSSFRSPSYSDPKYDYSLGVVLQLYDGSVSTPFVIR